MRRLAPLVLAVLVGCGSGPLQEGAAAFEKGDLDGAIAPWQQVVEEGNASGRLHYDLGNAWYRKGDLPRAVAHYRAAQRMRPRDGNVHHNLAVVRSELQGVPEPAELPVSWMAFATAGEVGVLGLLLTLAGSVLAVAWRRRPGRGWGLPAVSTWILGVALAFTSAVGAWSARWHPVAVVVDADAPARDLPRLDADERFVLPPGSELSVVRESGDFVLVEDGRGRRGWVTRAAVLLPDRRPVASS